MSKRDMINKKEAGYVTHAVEGHSCKGCIMFRPKKERCTLVKGEIKPNHWCEHWTMT